MSQIKNKTTLNTILIFSILALTATYFVQYVLGHKPCNLCLIERVPYIFVVLIIILSLILKKFEKLVLVLLSLIFVSATIISFYHFGIEQGFIAESLVCDLGSKKSKTTRNYTNKKKQKYIKIYNSACYCKNFKWKRCEACKK